ncbi:hypothetical protein GCM10010387_51540 [Streptomyces inusitatus]|uniref:Uncharacterized protein n=1 Tax=Streptomyces inusitatus TaxID=68221 RepID=A0A918QKK6_9ACTN|nr:hypothetical protein GCM10010387_51540 [Streptomyces inusitatus]
MENSRGGERVTDTMTDGAPKPCVPDRPAHRRIPLVESREQGGSRPKETPAKGRFGVRLG